MARIRKRTSKANKIERQKMGKIVHKRTEVDGIVFDSVMESDYYKYLKEERDAGRIKDFTLQPKFILQDKFIVVNGETIYGNHPEFAKIKRQTKAPTVQAIAYISDFEVDYADGHKEIVDIKGIETADFKIKKKLFACKYPHLELKIITRDKNGWIDYDTYQKEKRKIKKLKGQNIEENQSID